MKGEFKQIPVCSLERTSEPKGRLVLVLGTLVLIFVPFFKMITHLPAFMGMLFGVALLWVVTDIAHHKYDDRAHLRMPFILTKVDLGGTLFFLGVLFSICSLSHAGILKQFAYFLDKKVQNPALIATSIGLISSVVDNVSLVAACIGMYGLDVYPVNSPFWELIAYCAGTGGSILVIGSAAGVTFMAMEKVDFFWYFKNIALKALFGYVSGILVYLFFHSIVF